MALMNHDLPVQDKTKRLCDTCSVLSETDKTFCPECGTPYGSELTPRTDDTVQRSDSPSSKLRIVAVAPLAMLLLAELIRHVIFPHRPWVDPERTFADITPYVGNWLYILHPEFPGAVIAFAVSVATVVAIWRGYRTNLWCWAPLVVVLARMSIHLVKDDGWQVDMNPMNMFQKSPYAVDQFGVVVAATALAMIGAAVGRSR